LVGPRVRQWLKNLKPTPANWQNRLRVAGLFRSHLFFEKLVQQIVMVEKDEDVAAVWDVIVYGDGLRLAMTSSLLT